MAQTTVNKILLDRNTSYHSKVEHCFVRNGDNVEKKGRDPQTTGFILIYDNILMSVIIPLGKGITF